MSAKHTPGPWEIRRLGNGWELMGPMTDDGRWLVAKTVSREPTDEANIHLLAAAPELLESLREYAMSYTDSQLAQLAACETGMGEIGPERAKREIRRRIAIAKATGAQP
jgi:hypothetical protein